jgi:ubiquinone/menaquinone biosynthesis C-methylase UbiE/GT2 family glycosyltransferase
MALSFEIIVPTLNRPESLDKFLYSVLQQTTFPSKVTVIDAGERRLNFDKFQKLFIEKSILFKWHFTSKGLTHQRNFGIKLISCDLVLFSDDDVILYPEYIESILKIFHSDNKALIGGATGRMTNFTDKTTYLSRLFRRKFYLGYVADGSVLPSGFATGIDYANQKESEIGWLSGCNMVYRKELFEDLWFDENLVKYGYMEDLDFSYRVSEKYKLVYIPQACYEHYQVPQARLNDADRYTMLMRHHHYLFKKNFGIARSKFPHYLSLIGIPVQALLLQRSFRGFLGSMKGLAEIMFMHNNNLPNYLERLDYSKPSRIQIAEHEVRYNYAATFCINKLVLDCALGEGIGANIICKTAQKVVGVDLDPKVIESAKKNIKHPNIEFVCASALALPFPDNFFEIITSIETLEHIPLTYHDKVIAEFKRVLKPAGKLILSTPNKTRTSPGKIAPSNYFHLCELTFDELKALMENHFNNVSWVGLYNPIRDGQMNTIKQKLINKPEYNVGTKKPFRKKILLLMPFWLKDTISLAIHGRHIYPSVSEYQLIEKDAEYTNDLVFTGTK